MRIHDWSIAICSALLAAAALPLTAGEFAPRGFPTARPPLSRDAWEADPSESFELMQYAEPQGTGAVVPPVGGGSAFAVSPGGSQPDWTESYQQQAAWDTSAFAPERRVYFGTELLLAWGLSPGDTLIGSGEFANLNFFPDAPNSFPHQSTGAFPDQFHYGVRARAGWDNSDDSGVMLSGFAVFNNRQQRGPGRIFFGTDITQLQPLASIPLDDGGDGEVVPFDSEFAQYYNQDLYGGDLDLYLAPWFQRPSFQLRFLVGAKYLQISEHFQVQAGDSGLGYTVETTTNTIDYSTVRNIGIPPYQMQINSSTLTRLVGPQIGLRYDFGNEQIIVWGQTRFAVAANFEDTKLSGVNVVNGFRAAAQEGPPFSQSASTSHVSPVFDTSIYADFYLFAMLPLVRQVEFLRQAQFRIGFDYLLVSEIARPTNIITYNTPTPVLTSNRTWFDMKTLSLGLSWVF